MARERVKEEFSLVFTYNEVRIPMRSTYNISVIVPTFKRPDKLALCLSSLTKQTLPPQEILVTFQSSDSESEIIIDQYDGIIPLKKIALSKPGVIFAENEALKKVSGNIVAFTDDDAIVPPEWLEKISRHFETTINLIAVGGPDQLIGEPLEVRRKVISVGKISWYGKVIGNHHQLFDRITKVDVLKGVNMAFKREYLLPLDPLLHSDISLGNGSQWELDLCMRLKKKGYMFLFDPALEVQHDSHHATLDGPKSQMNNAHNLTYVLLKNYPLINKLAFILYAICVGNTNIVGLTKLFTLLFSCSTSDAFKRYYFTNVGFLRGIGTYMMQRSEQAADYSIC